VSTDAQAFFERPGDLYLVDITITHAAIALQFAIKADQDQLPYAQEILTQLQGAIGERGKLTITKTTVVDRVPGTVEAYTVRPPQRHEYQGRHTAPDNQVRHAD
jgi:hypothetical protein